MEYPHTIRLRGLWGYEVLVDQSPPGTQPEALSGVMRVPGDWSDTLGRFFRGRVRYRRTFNWPSQLEPHERVWLAIDGVDAHGDATLNGQPLGTIDGYALPARFEITPQLAKHNELWLDVACPPAVKDQAACLRPGRRYASGGPIGEVRLEVCSAASIASLALYVEPVEIRQIHVAGLVAGSGDDLTVVVIVAGREIASQAVTAAQPFKIVAAADGLPMWRDPADQAHTAPVECRLLSRGMCLWTGQRQMALPASGIFIPEPCLQMVDSGVANRRGARGLGRFGWLASREILADEVYDSLDWSGTRLVQGVRREWLERLAPRLAHHPSIAAWAALDPSARESNEPAYGRPWLSSDFWEQAAP
ncbi:MAG TPA: hypothetical protein VIK18_00535 [Pirellulales bacterium]